ncbi:hypothetical protein H1Z61_06555 [Bacillus aquiflavi]|uniref:Uncharacterized protein n=1 Tax=Bacillus aquiflavi TaxID=2672567 RepID=A0A6B3VW04_9BACI|nr:hypothetical protein [Bacillus aquiflavi]MBA4536815.1 hypothetical protein [Bacillus aquiflavi]NEY81182.1 hypothetical protein [Bacillus aquiflavi]UAC49743.1 hypothetical protein K6959_08110 [Bacillus aquiflavi]
MKYYETRHIFLAIAVMIAIASPLLLGFVPQTIVDLIHYKKGIWHVYVPTEAYPVYAVGLLLLFLSPLLLFLMRNSKVAILLSICCILFSGITFFTASQAYTLLSEDSLSYAPLFSMKDHIYTWDEVEKIIYYEADEGEMSDYEFLFHDGNSIKIKDDLYLSGYGFKLRDQLEKMNLNVEKVKKTSSVP